MLLWDCILSRKLERCSCGQPCDGKTTAGMVSSKGFAAVQKYTEGSDQRENQFYTWLFTLWALCTVSRGRKSAVGIHPVLATKTN